MDRIFLSLAVTKKALNFIHTLIQYASKTKIANSSENYVQIFFQLCQLKLLGCLLCFPKNKENSPRRNLEATSRSLVGSKKQAYPFYQQLPQQRHFGPERFFQKQSKALALYFSTFYRVINICQGKNYLCICNIPSFVKYYL